MSSSLFAFSAIVQQWAAASRPAVLNLPHDAILLYSSSRGDGPNHKITSFLLCNCNFATVLAHNAST